MQAATGHPVAHSAVGHGTALTKALGFDSLPSCRHQLQCSHTCQSHLLHEIECNCVGTPQQQTISDMQGCLKRCASPSRLFSKATLPWRSLVKCGSIPAAGIRPGLHSQDQISLWYMPHTHGPPGPSSCCCCCCCLFIGFKVNLAAAYHTNMCQVLKFWVCHDVQSRLYTPSWVKEPLCREAVYDMS